MATHNWPGVRADLRQVPRSDEEIDSEVAANRSRFDEHATPIRTRASDMRHAALRRPGVLPVGGGWLRTFFGWFRWLRKPYAFRKWRV